MVSEMWKVDDQVMWNGWDAVVVNVFPDQVYAYRLGIQTVTGDTFTVLARPEEVRLRNPASRRYTSELQVAIHEVEAEDVRRVLDEKEIEHLWQALSWAEREAECFRWGAAAMVAAALAVGFIWGWCSK